MKSIILKTLSLIVLVTCFGKMNAQSDLLALNAVNTISVPAEVAALYGNEEKIKVSDFTQNPISNSTLVRVKCATAVTMQVKVFNLNGDMAKEETHTLNGGTSDVTVDMDSLAAGTYMVQFYTKEGSAVRRFIKTN
jgi:hypothetical protein